MAQDQHEAGNEQVPGEGVANVWALYRHAARLIVDHVYIVSIDLNPLSAGFLIAEAGDLYPEADGALGAAKAHLADSAEATAFSADMSSNSINALKLLLDELSDQRELADELSGIRHEFDDESGEGPQ